MRIGPPPRTHPGLWAAALLVVLSACASGPARKPDLVYGLTLAPTGIDPHINASAELGIPLSSVYDTLLFQDPASGRFVPGLAESWTTSQDGRVYTFRLRRDVIFHDGTPFDAQAVVDNIDYIMDPDHHSQKAVFMLGPLERAEAVDDFTVALHLSQPFAPLLDSLSQVYLGMASPAALNRWGPAEYAFHQVGTGPYRFVEYVPNDHLTLRRNPDYAWAPEVVRQSSASIETIVFRFFVDAPSRALALESGQVHVIGEIPAHDARRLGQKAEFRLMPVPIPGHPLQLFFNTRRSPTDDAAVRRALVQAVDRQRVVSTVFGEYSPIAQGPLSSSAEGFDPGSPFPSFDQQAAAQALDSAGWVLDDQGRRRRDGQSLVLRVIVPTWGSYPEVIQLIQADWEAIGAQVLVEIAPTFGNLRQAQSAGEYHAIGNNFFGRDPDLLRTFYSTGGIYNWSGIADPELDEILARAAGTLDEAERRSLYAQASHRIRDQALILPIREYVNLVVYSERLEGLHFSSQGWFPFLIDLRWSP